jgi:hypothetical protein
MKNEKKDVKFVKINWHKKQITHGLWILNYKLRSLRPQRNN